MSVTSLKYFSVFLSASLKFIGGIVVGVVEQLSILEVALFTFLGSMTSIAVIVILGNRYRTYFTLLFHRLKLVFYFFVFRVGVFLHLSPYQGIFLRDYLKEKSKKRKFSKTIRFTIKTWKRFGILGIAILTPVILSPIGGALLAVSFRVGTKKTMFYMFLSNLFFALLFSYVFIEFKELIENNLGIRLRKEH